MSHDKLFDLSQKNVVLTGATGLIGRCLAKHFAERGAKLMLVDLDSSALKELQSEIEGDGHAHFAGDVSQSSTVAALVENSVKSLGSVNVLINGHQYKPKGFLEATPENFPEELWDSIMGANLKGTFLTCRDFGKHMLSHGAGSIINFASTYGVVSSNPALYEDNAMGNPLAYTASKGGVIMMTQYLGCYWASKGVRVNCVTPHGVWNNHEDAFVERFSSMSPMKRLMTADEVVGSCVYLASDASSYSTGSNLLVEGGWTAW